MGEAVYLPAIPALGPTAQPGMKRQWIWGCDPSPQYLGASWRNVCASWNFSLKTVDRYELEIVEVTVRIIMIYRT